jgi:hypothetical protein
MFTAPLELVVWRVMVTLLPDTVVLNWLADVAEAAGVEAAGVVVAVVEAAGVAVVIVETAAGAAVFADVVVVVSEVDPLLPEACVAATAVSACAAVTGAVRTSADVSDCSDSAVSCSSADDSSDETPLVRLSLCRCSCPAAPFTCICL